MVDDLDEDGFFDLLSRFQSRRIDDQRCSFRLLESVPATPKQVISDGNKDLAALGQCPDPPLSSLIMALHSPPVISPLSLFPPVLFPHPIFICLPLPLSLPIPPPKSLSEFCCRLINGKHGK